MPLDNLRVYGNPPFRIAVLHGGPGAAGEMAPVAQKLSNAWGVLEPLQTARTITGQIEELKTVLHPYASGPLHMIGFSWGAWLAVLFGAQYPEYIKKIILIGSGGFEEQDAVRTQKTRMQRLSAEERRRIDTLTQALVKTRPAQRDAALMQLGEIFSRADAWDPLADALAPVTVSADIYQSVWEEAALLRKNKKLLEAVSRLRCPVVAFHGDYDPHPVEGVQGPLSAALADFRLIRLEHCGHKPWIERQAHDTFYRLLKAELDPA